MVLKQGLVYTLVRTLSLLHEINNYGNNLFFSYGHYQLCSSNVALPFVK